MQIFLSYASEDRDLADQVHLALSAGGHQVFFDRDSLPPGGDYHSRIRNAVEHSDVFVFLISPNSIAAGSYSLTELKYARAKWAHPKNRVLPVLLQEIDFEQIPTYLKAVTVLEPEGSVPAETLVALSKMTEPVRKSEVAAHTSKHNGDQKSSPAIEGTHKVMVPLLVAVIGLVGVLGAAVISNWDELFGGGKSADQYPDTPMASTANAESEATITPAEKALEELNAARRGASTNAGSDHSPSTNDRPFASERGAAAIGTVSGGPGQPEVSTSGLRAEVEGVKQAVDLLTAAPQTISGEPVLCDTLRLNLVLAHRGEPKAPISINSIAIRAKPISLSELKNGDICKIDNLSSVPYGISDRDVFLVQVDDRSINSRYLRDANQAVAVDSDNLLDSELASNGNLLDAKISSRAITLKHDGEPINLYFAVQSTASEPQEISYLISYDQGGEKTIATRRVVLWK